MLLIPNQNIPPVKYSSSCPDRPIGGGSGADDVIMASADENKSERVYECRIPGCLFTATSDMLITEHMWSNHPFKLKRKIHLTSLSRASSPCSSAAVATASVATVDAAASTMSAAGRKRQMLNERYIAALLGKVPIVSPAATTAVAAAADVATVTSSRGDSDEEWVAPIRNIHRLCIYDPMFHVGEPKAKRTIFTDWRTKQTPEMKEEALNKKFARNFRLRGRSLKLVQVRYSLPCRACVRVCVCVCVCMIECVRA